ncbi:MAG TPA: hypothetical protein VEB66_06420 [Opitutaceae bacterium]|nr:hypothetical protein [Opitutaceae bacterium]
MAIAEVIVIGILILGSVAIGWWIGVAAGRRSLANLTALADRLGLELAVSKFLNLVTRASVHGAVQGRPVRFWSYTTGSGKSQQTWAAVGVTPRQASGLEFRLSRQGFATKVQEFFGSKEITVGDAEFDRAWFVRTNRPEFLAAALVPEIRAKLVAAHRAGGDGSFRLERGEVVYAERGSVGSARVVARLEAVLPVLLDLADVAEVAGAPA